MRRFLQIILFPWGLSRLFAWPFRSVRSRTKSVPAAYALFTGQMLVQLFVVVPLSLLILMEIVIVVNRAVVGDQANYRLVSDFEAGMADTPIDLPGEPAPPVDLPDEADPDFDERLVEAYAPVFVHETAHRPLWDIPVRVDFDGSFDPRDNPDNMRAAERLTATVYGELTAITEDSYYLTYSLYHGTDYDHPLREWVSRWTYHDSDNEGLHIRVDRGTGRVMQAETWYHNRFLLCSTRPGSTGTEPVTASIQLEGARRLIVYAQSQGHGVRCAQKSDQEAIASSKIMRPRLARDAIDPLPDRSFQGDVTYELASFDEWYERGASFRSSTGLFADSIVLRAATAGEGAWVVGRFISGRDREEVGAWSRPKPPWAWDDGWDEIPITFWHFLPSVSFESHSGEALSHEYLRNRPVDRLFGVTAAEFMEMADVATEYREGDKWADLENRGEPSRDYYWQAALLGMSRYINRVFLALG